MIIMFLVNNNKFFNARKRKTLCAQVKRSAPEVAADAQRAAFWCKTPFSSHQYLFKKKRNRWKYKEYWRLRNDLVKCWISAHKSLLRFAERRSNVLAAVTNFIYKKVTIQEIIINICSVKTEKMFFQIHLVIYSASRSFTLQYRK